MDDERKCTIIKLSITALVLLAVFGYYGMTVKAIHEQDEQIQIARVEYIDRMESCVRNGYTFVVDGIEMEKASDDFPSTSFGKYNVTYDDAGKQVIMTTLQTSPRNYISIPIFFFMP